MLVCLLLAERHVDLVANDGSNRHMNPQAWQDMVQRLGQSLRDGNFEERQLLSADDVSALIVRHFPLALGQVRRNELQDQPVLL